MDRTKDYYAHLLTLGVDESVFTLTQELVRGQYDILHIPGGRCQVSPERSREVLSLGTLPRGKECWCLTEDPQAPVLWRALGVLLNILGNTEHLIFRGSPLILGKFYDLLERYETTLRDASPPVELAAAYHALAGELQDQRQVYQELLSSTETQEQFCEDLGVLVLGSVRELVGITPEAFHYRASGYDRALYYSYGRKVGDRWVLNVPQEMGHHLSLQFSAEDHSRGTLQDSDTFSIMETASSLWDPHSSGALQHMDAALAAARSLEA